MSHNTELNDGRVPGYRGLRIFILAVFAIVTAVVSVSFAANHMRIGFETEYRSQVNEKAVQIAEVCSNMISGDEIESDPTTAQQKYAAVLPAIVVSPEISSSDDGSTRDSRVYALYSYSNGALTTLLQSSPDGIYATTIPVSVWLTENASIYSIQEGNRTTVLSPIKDSQGKVTGLFELSVSYDFLGHFGSQVEKRALMSALLAVGFGIFLFSLQYIVPATVRLIRKKGGLSK